MRVNKNTDSINLESITKAHNIVFAIDSFWYMLAYLYEDKYCAINMANNTVIHENYHSIKIEHLDYWHNKAEEMHAFYSLEECLKFIKS